MLTSGRYDLKNPFSRILALFSGTAGGYLIVIVMSPVLTRLFDPEEMGLFGVYSAAVAVFSVIFVLGFDYAIVGANRRSEALRACLASVLVTVLLAAFFTVFATVGALATVFYIPNQSVAVLLAAIPVAVVAIFFTISSNWAIRSGNTIAATRGLFVSLSARALIQVPLGFLFGGVWSLLGGDALGRGLALPATDLRMLRFCFKILRKNTRNTIGWIKKQYRFPVFLMPANLLEVLYLWAPPTLFSLTHGVAAAGIMTLILRFSTAPSAVANLSFAQIFHQYAGENITHSPKLVAKRLLQIAVVTTLAFIPGWLVLVFFHEVIFEVVFGTEWSVAGIAAPVFTPLVLSQVLNVFANRVLIVLNVQHFRLNFFLACFLLSLTSSLVGYVFNFDFITTLVIMSASTFMFQMGWFVATLILIQRPYAEKSMSMLK